MGIVLIVVGTILVGIRCGNSISEEKRRKTWEDLVLTPLTIAEIMGGKRRGILVAACSPLIAYALPMFGLAALGGTTGFVSAAVWATLAFVAMIAAAFIGMAVAEGDQGLSRDGSARLQQMILTGTGERAHARRLNTPAEGNLVRGEAGTPE
jgi:hypothetical protein